MTDDIAARAGFRCASRETPDVKVSHIALTTSRDADNFIHVVGGRVESLPRGLRFGSADTGLRPNICDNRTVARFAITGVSWRTRATGVSRASLALNHAQAIG